MKSKAGNSILLEKYRCLTELFPLNESLQHDLLQLRSIENDSDESTNRNGKTVRAFTIWSWIIQSVKKARIYAGETVNKLLYRCWNSLQPIEKILDECNKCCKIINASATQLFEFRKHIGTRLLHSSEEQFLLSNYDILLAIYNFLESHINDDEISHFLKSNNVEKRFNFTAVKINLKIGQLDKSNIFTMVKYVEEMLNLSELTACTILEFGFRVTHSELMRTRYQSYCCCNYFSKLNDGLIRLRRDIQDIWTAYDKFLANESEKISEIKNCEPIPIASKFTREYKLWKNSMEMNEIGTEMIQIYESIATSAVALLEKNIAPNFESENENNLTEDNCSKDDQLHIQSLMSDSNVILAKLIRLSCVNEGILSGMLRAKDNVAKIVPKNFSSVSQSNNVNTNLVDEIELSDRDAVKSIYEQGQDDPDFFSTEKNCLDRSEKFEVYQLQERNESDEEIDNAEKTYEWETNVKEVKATHNFVMSELKQVLVGVKDVMTKRENEAFIKKYGASFTEESNSVKCDEDKSEFMDNTNSFYEDYRSDSSVRRRNLMTKSLNQEEYSDVEASKLFQPTSSRNQINIMMHRPNFIPLTDEYTIDDTGSESESACDET